MFRITMTSVENVTRFVNELMPGELFVSIEGRNGGIGVDLCYMAEGTMRHARTLTFGTKREVFDYLHAMREGMLLVKGR